MIKFLTSSTFRKSIESMLKVKRGVYAGVESEIRDSFKGQTLKEIQNNRDVILMRTDSVVIKLRIQDRKNHLSKSNGFRLIYMAYKEVEQVVMMDIYPKRGPLQKLDISDAELDRLIDEVDQEYTDNVLKVFSIE